MPRLRIPTSIVLVASIGLAACGVTDPSGAASTTFEGDGTVLDEGAGHGCAWEA